MMRFEETDAHYFECILEKRPALIKDKWMKFYEAGFKEGQRYISRVEQPGSEEHAEIVKNIQEIMNSELDLSQFA